MAKTKEQSKSGSKVKSEVKPLSKVQNAAVTKPSQTPIAKSKQVAKDVASKAMNGKADKKSRKVTPPSSDEESDDESAESASSEDESEAEIEVKKLVAATNSKANSNGKMKKEEVDTSDSSSSSASDSEASDSETSDSDSSGGEKSAAEDSDDSDDSDASDAESEAPAPVVAAAKNAAKKTVEAGKATVNGAAKAVAKATETSDEEEDDDSGDSASSEDEDEEKDEDGDGEEEDDDDDDDSDDSDDSESASDEEPSKKRKADDEPAVFAKKAKKETPTGVEDTGSKNLFVGNLSWNVDDEWLYREFEEFGELTGARVISDRESGRSKGFGYVEFANSADAAKALKAKKGALIDGREANVDFSTPRGDNQAPKERANQRAKSFGDSKNPESDTLFVGNLSFEADQDTVGEAFGEYGTVTNVRLPTDMESGNPKGFGYVTFASVEDAKKAYENLMGADIAGRPVRLDFATPRTNDSSGSRGGRGGGRGGRGGFGDRGGRGGGRGGRGSFGDRGGRGSSRGGRSASTNRGGFGDFSGKKQTF